MRRALLLLVRQMASSRQSPRMSPDRAGVALVPLLEATPLAVSRRVSLPVPYLSMRVWSSSSRTGSASHQMTKLAEDGVRPTEPPEVLNRLVMFGPAPQNSAPALPA